MVDILAMLGIWNHSIGIVVAPTVITVSHGAEPWAYPQGAARRGCASGFLRTSLPLADPKQTAEPLEDNSEPQKPFHNGGPANQMRVLTSITYYACMYTCMRTRICTHFNKSVYIHLVCIHAPIHVHTCTCPSMYVYAYLSIYTFIYVCNTHYGLF